MIIKLKKVLINHDINCIIQLLYAPIIWTKIQKGLIWMKQIDIKQFRDLIRQLQRSLNWQWRLDASCCGVTVAQCHTIMEVGKTGRISIAELATALNLDISTVSRTIEGMVGAGLVKRTANPDDRRSVYIVLTEKGKSVYNDINSTYDAYYAEILADVPQDKQRQVMESIELLAQATAKTVNTASCSKEANNEQPAS